MFLPFKKLVEHVCKPHTLFGTQCRTNYIIEMKQVVNEFADIHCPVVEIPTRSKLSYLSWNKYLKPLIASSDYEGIVTVWDVNTKQVGERRNL